MSVSRYAVSMAANDTLACHDVINLTAFNGMTKFPIGIYETCIKCISTLMGHPYITPFLLVTQKTINFTISNKGRHAF